MGWSDPKYQVTPDCCEAMIASLAIVIRCDLNEEHGCSGEFGPPHWHLRVRWDRDNYGQGDCSAYLDRFGEAADHPRFCPFCGQELPAIRQRPSHMRPKKVATGTDGNYCDTCNERNMDCRCAPPWAGWEAEPTGKPTVRNLTPLKCVKCGEEKDEQSLYIAYEHEIRNDVEYTVDIRVCFKCGESIEKRRKA